jgi:polysaccharide export outer membrane protein
MKKLLFILLVFISYLFAVNAPAVVEAVKSNPALLNTPQVQEVLKEHDISSGQVLKKIEGPESANSMNEIQSQQKIKNKIEINNEKENREKFNKSSKKKEYNIDLIERNAIINKPLEYLPEKTLIRLIQSKRQIIKKTHLKRFGEKFFYNKNSLNKRILAVPEYYQLNIGDIVLVRIFGGNDRTITLKVDNNGNIYLPVIGPIYVAGLSVAEVKYLIKKKLEPTYPNSKIVVDVKVNSFIQVSLTGYVNAPGIYNLSSLSTVKDLLIAANGFGKIGSMREVYLKRNGKILKIIDFYKLIKDGDLVDTTLLRNGDIIYVPRAKILVSLRGAVSTPAIYEMKRREKLKDLINFSGGLLPDASDKSIKIKRYVNNSYTKVMFKNLKDTFHFKNGDEVYVYKISELNQNYVTVYGNIEKPGSYEIPKDKKLKTLLKKFTYLKDTYYNYGVIRTFDNKIISFSLKNPGNIKIHKKDEIFIFNKYEIIPEEYVVIKGKVKVPGKYRWYKGLTLIDAINNSGLDVANLKKVQIITFDKNFRPVLKYVNALKNPNYKLKPFDEITLFDYYSFKPLHYISVYGAVHKPGTFVYAKGMNLKDALTMAGWLKDKADKNYIELIRYKIVNNQRMRIIKKLTIKDLNFTIKPYDEVYVKTIPNWYERKTVILRGEVKYPGVYVIEEGDRLADIIKRAGGFTKNAYLYGAVFTRESVRKLQEERLKKMIYKLKKKIAIIAASAKGAGERSLDAKNLIQAIDSVAKQAEKLKPVGRIALILERNLTKFEKSPYNIVVENGDTLYVPSKKDNVIVLGEVLTPTAFVYTSDKALDYIKKAGGRTSLADDIYFVVHANGFTEKGEFGSWFDKNVRVKPGDAITVPIQIKTSTWYGIAKDISTILYQFAITAASLKTVGAF